MGVPHQEPKKDFEFLSVKMKKNHRAQFSSLAEILWPTLTSCSLVAHVCCFSSNFWKAPFCLIYGNTKNKLTWAVYEQMISKWASSQSEPQNLSYCHPNSPPSSSFSLQPLGSLLYFSLSHHMKSIWSANEQAVKVSHKISATVVLIALLPALSLFNH